MHLNVATLKLKSNESELTKKKCTFLDLIFFYRSLKLVYLCWAGFNLSNKNFKARAQCSVYVLKFTLVYKFDRIKASY